MSGKKSTAAEVEMRTAKVAALLIDGWCRARICEYARETARWDVSDAQVDRYMAKARERIQADCSRDRKASYALAEARLEACQRAEALHRSSGERRAAARARRGIARARTRPHGTVRRRHAGARANQNPR